MYIVHHHLLVMCCIPFKKRRPSGQVSWLKTGGGLCFLWQWRELEWKGGKYDKCEGSENRIMTLMENIGETPLWKLLIWGVNL